MDGTDNSNLKCINLIEAEVRLDTIMVREDFKIKCTEDDQGMDKTIEVGQGMILIIEVAMGIIQEVIRGMGGKIIAITEGETLEIKIMTGIGVGHTKDRAETEGTVEALVIVDQGQVQGHLQIEMELDVLSVGNMITLQGTVQLDKQVGK